MIRYCVEKWDANKDNLRERIKNDDHINERTYDYLVKLVVEEIFNDGFKKGEYGEPYPRWDTERITTIDDGDYQGTLLFLIPEDTYQPSEYEYLMTYVDYGSCSGCDTLQAVQSLNFIDQHGLPSERQVKDYMDLCLGILENTIKPYNNGWREDESFKTI